MKRILYLIIYMALLSACNVHEWPEEPERVPFCLKLNYDKDMTAWSHRYDGTDVTEQSVGGTYDNGRADGKIRYIVCAYPVSGNRQTTQEPAREFVSIKNISQGYDHEMTLDLAPGDYSIMVWSDLMEDGGGDPYYNTDNFAEISLQGGHEAGNDYRDAFRGTGSISLAADIMEHSPGTLSIAMQRPLAKFEFVTDDVAEFIEMQTLNMAAGNGGARSASEDESSARVNIEDYQVVFSYVGFMPDTYSMFTDKPVDSSTGVMFRSSLKALSDSEASLGFDYVFVNGTESSVTLQVGIYNARGERISLSKPITVPLKRSRHTVLHGMFLTADAAGGVTINPDFDGDYNLVFP